MDMIRLTAHVDEQHHLVAQVPACIPPGRVTVIIVPASDEDDAGRMWMAGIAREWADELSDPREDIYTLTDGESVSASG